jgi:sec-independent protein translocase protein TatB
MEILGIGPMELLLIILLAIIIFGPKDIANAAKTVGKSLNKFIRSDTWKTINQTSQELKNLPTKLMREAGLEELEKTARGEPTKTEQSIHPSVTTIPTPDTPPGVIKEQPIPPDSQKIEPPDKKAPE